MVDEAFAHLDDKFERKIDALAERMERAFAETQAMIKFSHVELDRRIRSLEETNRALEETQRKHEDAISDLQSRVERLESPAH